MPSSLANQTQRDLARRWLGLAVGSLVLAGLFSLVLVVGRMPPFSDWITDPLFFRRCLVVHVTLALGVWFYSYLAALFALLPAEGGAGRAARFSPYLALAGLAMIMAAAGLPGTEPVLSNYVPMIDHPLFVAGLVTFAAAVLSSLLDRRLLPAREVAAGLFDVPAEARPAFRAAALAFLLAMLTFLAAALTTPRWLPAATYYETVAWGGGHVLQFASVAAMMGVWLTLLGNALGRPVMSRRMSAALFAALVLPLFFAPVLAVRGDRVAFTRLMELAIFPVTLFVLGMCLRAIRAARPSWRDPAVAGFGISAVLTVLGFVLGALIHGSNTLVPAHYHAAIGAVTASFMAFTWPLLERLGVSVGTGRLARAATWQPVMFGIGQTVFAFGFAFAGAHGMGRKLYGQEQHVRSLAETAGLAVMGLGGLVAVAAGLLFLAIVSSAWLRAYGRNQTWARSGDTPSRG
jgi:hypothetical protein